MEHFRHDVFAQLLARFSEFKKKSAGHLDQATVNAELSREFERRWAEPEGPESMVPGKEVLARLNSKLQGDLGVTVTDGQIASKFSTQTIPADVNSLL